MKNDALRRVLLAVAVPATLTVNALANVQRWGGVTTGDVSARYPTLITPASYAFLIWNVIYLGLLGLAFYQALPSRDADPALRAVRSPLLASCAANAAWITLWHNDLIPLSLLAIAALTASLAVAFARLLRFAPASAAERWLVRAPISVYLGWVSVATVVNAAVAGVALGTPASYTPLSEAGAVLALSGGALVGGFLASRARGGFDVALTVLWAYAAIAVAQSQSLAVMAAAVVGALAVLAAAAALPPGSRGRESRARAARA